MQNVSISSFYHFIEIQNVEDIRDALLDFCVDSNLLGTILVSNEGFNGTITGEKLDILKAFSFLCLLYTSPSPRDLSTSRMPSSA